ncbi:hypothetical protein [Micromonospora sp. KC213]|uniref:hypothetical protein n=1 Tax=Micromonospora sp. KC213 TaxID=2530378 RepID=UPI00104B233F|nr:hypothetical protein [Micromonospora sp. KC213]TDC41351.1 hypothetical protein E1166_11945 [Micromonospora sp. KC213]
MPAASAEPAASQPARPPAPAAFTAPDEALGRSWRTSDDVVVTGAGDTEGYHLYVAREKDAFGWSTLATLTSSSIAVGPWTGAVCVTGSGRYAVAVFAPKKAANEPGLARAGALAAVVDVTTGKATHVATGVELAYFNPACGPDDRALLTRSLGDDFAQSTELLTVDAAAGRVTRTRRIAGQLTTPAPATDGDYGILGGHLVRIDDRGRTARLARPAGNTFGVQATAGSGIDVIGVQGQQALAQRFRAGRLTTVASGPWDQLQLFGQRGGRNVLVGQAQVRGAVPELGVVPADRKVRTLSESGHLVVEEIVTQQSMRSVGQPLSPADPADAGDVRVTVRATVSGEQATRTIRTTRAPRLDVELGSSTPKPAGARGALASAELTPTCAVPRNDPKVQPLQPSPDMVEWAVDQAVHGRLTVSRPANYLKAGLPAYQPQVLFPRRQLAGGGTVPAQVMLAILAQETNLSQASWHVVPGDTGNPLIASYYGNEGNLDVIDYSKTDCGYGIGQVTDGMRVGSTVFTDTQRRAIAVDYAANIAAGMNILIEKWNQMASELSAHQSYMNNNDPTWVENWFLAAWAYNSGYYPYANRDKNNGRWGVGWFNNPANPRYPANRAPFLRLTMADAERPNDWAYAERIMGWVESPQLKGFPVMSAAYAEPTYGANSPRTGPQGNEQVLSIPGRYAFCSTVNNCSQATNGCPADSELCWWHGVAHSGNCLQAECAKEKLTFGSGTAEPGVKRIYERNCETFTGDKNGNRDTSKRISVVYTLNDTGQYNLGCSIGASDGKFTIRRGLPAGGSTAPYAEVDLHQIGAGYKGHIWYTYVNQSNPNRRIVGSWTPNLDLAPGERARYDIVAHVPSHGADHDGAEYLITRGAVLGQATCAINFAEEAGWSIGGVPNPNPANLGEDKWVYLGSYELGRGAQVQLSNYGTEIVRGFDAVGFDAMAFVPIGTNPGHSCKDDY